MYTQFFCTHIYNALIPCNNNAVCGVNAGPDARAENEKGVSLRTQTSHSSVTTRRSHNPKQTDITADSMQV